MHLGEAKFKKQPEQFISVKNSDVRRQSRINKELRNSHVEDAVILLGDGARLSAEIVHSTTAPNKGTVIFVHGFAGNKHENGLFSEIAENLSSNGFDSVLYDWRGIGQSEGEFYSTPLTKHVEDFEQVMQWAQEHFPDSSGSLSAVGFSLGAAVVGLALDQHVPLNSVAYISPAVRPRLSMWPRYNNPELMRTIEERGFVEKPGSTVLLGKPILESLRDTDLGPHAFDVGIPLLVAYGTKDSLIDPSHNRELIQEKGPSENFRHIEFDDASHSLRPADVNWKRLATEISSWFSYQKV